jgi:hypothetical protein
MTMGAKTDRRSRSYCEVIHSEVESLEEILEVSRTLKKIDRETYDWCRSSIAEIWRAAASWDSSGALAVKQRRAR